MSVLVDALSVLRAAVDGVLALGGVSEGEFGLHEFVVGVQREQDRLVAGAAPAVRAWERSGVWGVDGSLSAGSRLSVETGVSRGSARRVSRRARCLGQMPVTAVALADGVLSVDHVDLLARAARGHRRELFVRDEAVLVGVCGSMIWDDAVRAVEYWCSRADADGAGDGDRERGAARGAGAHVHASSTLDGTVVVSGVLDPVSGEVFRNELDRLEHLLYLADLESGSDRTAAQQRAVALVEMATRSATAPAVLRSSVRSSFALRLAGRRSPLAAGVLCRSPNSTCHRPSRAVERPSRQPGERRASLRVTGEHGAVLAVASQPGRTHDHDARPLPEQRVDRLETYRARIRWALLRHQEHEDPEPEPGS